jgi:TIR domain-containing protein
VYRIFISHGSELRGKGFDVFVDYDSLSGGEDSSESIMSSLRNAELVLFVVPKESGEGKNALYEVGAAKALGKKIFAVMPHGRGSGARDVALGLADLIFLDTSETEPGRVADIVESTVHGRSSPQERTH